MHGIVFVMALLIAVSFALGWISRSFFMVRYEATDGGFRRIKKSFFPNGGTIFYAHVQEITKENNPKMFRELEKVSAKFGPSFSGFNHPLATMHMENMRRRSSTVS